MNYYITSRENKKIKSKLNINSGDFAIFVVNLFHMHKLLAKIFDRRGRFYSLFTLIVVFSVFYLSTNHITLWQPPNLPLFNFEKNIPFWPWTVFVYLSVFLQVALAAIIIKRKKFGKAMAGMVGIILWCSLIFLLWPTSYIRPALVKNASQITLTVYHFLTTIDTPQNCFPSQHVALCVFSMLAIFKQNRFWGGVFFFWTGLILISTLTLKQHFFVDIIGGIIMAFIFYFLSFKSKIKIEIPLINKL